MSAISSFRRITAPALLQPASERLILQLLQGLERTDGVANRFGGDMRIAGGGRQLGMAQKDLDHPDIGVRLQKVGGKAVAQGVQRRGLGDRGQALGGGESPVELPGRDRTDPRLAGKQPALRPRSRQ